MKESNVEKIYTLTPMQEGMLYQKLMDGNSTAYVIQSVFRYEGELCIETVKQSLSLLSRKYEVLRTAFISTEAKPLQVILRNRYPELNIKYTVDKSEIESLKKADISRGFDLRNDSLVRVTIINGENECVILWTMHHIITDGWCLALLFGKFLKYYIKLTSGVNYETIKRVIENENESIGSYQEYIRLIEQKDKETGLRYWDQLLEGYSEHAGVAPMQGEETDDQVECLTIEISKELSTKLIAFAQKEKITLNNIAEVAWGIVLQKYNQVNDVVFGKVVSGRNKHIEGIESMVGLFINTVPMRVRNEQNTTIRELLKAIHRQGIDSDEYDYCSLSEVLGRSELGRHLFSTLFVFENYYVDKSAFDKSQQFEAVTMMDNREQTNYSLTLSAAYSEYLHFKLLYDPRIYGKVEVGLILKRLETVLSEISINPDKKIVDIDILSELESNQLLYKFNDTYADYPRDKTIHELFEEQVLRTPDNIALVFGEESMTYSELNAKSNQLAHMLRSKGVQPDSIVGIMVGRSFEMIIGIMGILKAGGAYLPIDPEYPKERIRFMLEDSNAKIILTQSWFKDTVVYGGEKIELDGEIYLGVKANLAKINSSHDLAYVIYTSGSAGMPKGVLIEHKSVNRLVKNTNYIELGESSVIMQTGSMAFDASTFEVWGTLLNGGKLILAELEVITSAEKLKEYISKWRVNTMWCTSSLYNQLIRMDVNIFDGLHNLLIGGEKLSEKHVYEFKDQNALTRLINGYGPTENTTFTTTFEIAEAHAVIPIGKPICNTQIYIMNGLQLCGVGIPGELCIGGEGLARGYLNRPELTAEKFVDNPFKPGERIYRTGDLARWLPDGNIEFLGRIDHQVKIRGFRIELGEIESRLLELEQVKEAVVLAKDDDSGDKYLCAYIVYDAELNVSNIRTSLSATLPDYMMPSYFMRIDSIPLTPNGKVDRRALPEPEGVVGTEYVAPRNATEEVLASIWSQVLNKEHVGIYDNFFELGGHSLKGVVLVSRIHKELSVELPLRELFKAPTISGVSDYIAGATESVYASIEPAVEKVYYEASSAQKRIWLLQQFNTASIGYNMPGVLMLDGGLDKERFESAFRGLIARHEALRTSFDMIEGEIVQRITSADEVEFKIDYAEVSEAEIDSSVKEFVRVFDLSQAPMLRVGLVKVSESRYYLMFDMHHIISDGTSMAILTKEFMALYEGHRLNEQRLQYKDFSQWQNVFLKSEQMQSQESYWLERFSDELPVLNLPLDYARPPVQEFAGDSTRFVIGEDLTEKLRKIARGSGTTMYMVLLSALNILLSKYSGLEDIIVGSPIAGRPHADLEGIMGMFVNTLAMRSYPAGVKTYSEFLQEVKETALQAYENQDYQFEELIDKLDLRRDLSRNPLFDVMFVLQNMEATEFELEGLKLSRYSSGHGASKFDLTFTAIELGNEIAMNIEYATSLFKTETIERMSLHLQNLFRAIAEDREVLLGDIDILPESERNQLLYEFNDTYADYPRDKTIHELFEEQVLRTPDNIALVFGEESMTYSELNAKSNQLAHMLRSKGVKPDCIVGIMVERSFEMIIGIMGILKAGGAYLPIDPEYPEERIRFMLEDSNTEIMLSQSWLSYKVGFDGERIDLDGEVYISENENPMGVNSASDLVYVYYTSGTTGNPKGILATHRNAFKYMWDMMNKALFTSDKSILCLTTHSFDPFVSESLLPLIAGMGIFIFKGSSSDNKLLLEFISDTNVDILQITPSRLNALLEMDSSSKKEHLDCLSEILIGGELWGKDLLHKLCKHTRANVYNVYGPTETTVWSTIEKVSVDFDITIGKPMANTSIYIVDHNAKLNPIGIPGELCISGEGLARGYLNRPELTSEKFVPNPFKSGERMYRSGDLARWLPDGNIEFLGRIDHQVKIRGFRIELGEIESRLLELEQVKEVVVLAKDDESSDKYLCAYIVSDDELKVSDIRTSLTSTLPDYMVPSYFMRLDSIPLTSNGKVDRRALPEPEGVVGTEFVAPRTATEEVLATIWSEVLNKDKVGIYDNFFELGGHSLKGIVLVSKIHKALSVELPLGELFKAPTISGISEYISGASESIYASIEPAAEKAYYEASSVQKRIWTLQQQNDKSTKYNMQRAYEIEGKLDKKLLEKNFIQSANCYEPLKMTFGEIGDNIVLKIAEEVNFELEFVETVEGDKKSVVESFIQPFDLSKSPLFRVGLFKLNKYYHFMVVDIHQIIFVDALFDALMEEIIRLYERNGLDNTVQFKEFLDL